MTCRTTRQHCLRLHLVLLEPASTGRNLLSCCVLSMPFHIKNLALIPHKSFGRAMAFETPFHLQCLGLINHRHLIDATMTGRAADALVHMNAVIEIDVVGQIVHPRPLERRAVLETGAHRLEIRAVRPDLFVTVHAHSRRGNARRSGRLNGSVTIPAIDAIVADMMFMAELNRLLNFNRLTRVPGGTADRSGNPKGGQQNEDRAEDRGPRKCIRTVVKNLWHRRSLANT
jgi:hypothetical protein